MTQILPETSKAEIKDPFYTVCVTPPAPTCTAVAKCQPCALADLEITLGPLFPQFGISIHGRWQICSCFVISHVIWRRFVNAASSPSSHLDPCLLGQGAVNDTRLNTKW